MTFDEYQQIARSTAIYPADLKGIYPALGLSGEIGEVIEHIKKSLRDDARTMSDERRGKLEKEMGDVLWYLANIASDYGLTLDSIAARNVEKIKGREARGTLHGAGDDR